jgi:hypothetical protein
VVQIAVELVEPVHGRQKLVAVAKVVLAKLAGRITHGFEDRRNGRRFIGHTKRRTCLTDSGEPGADR